MFAKIFYKEVANVVDQKNKQKTKDKQSKKIQSEYAEKHRQNDIILSKKIEFLQEKIDIAEIYLRNEVDVLGMFEQNKEFIETWFYQNHWLKTLNERLVPANFGEIKMHPEQKRELLKRLQLRPEQYVQHGILPTLTEDKTLEFIIEHTPVIEELRKAQDEKGYRLYVANHYTDKYRKDITICFGLVINDDAVQPF